MLKADPQKKIILDSAFWSIIAGFIGARLGHVFFYEPHFFLNHPEAIVKVWEGGMSSFGSFIGAGICLWYFVQKHSLNLQRVADFFLISAIPGWIIGRIGCFMIHDHLGAHSNCPLAVMTPNGSRLDMALMEILGLLPLALLLYIFRKKELRVGYRSVLILMYYSLLRFILDFWRAADIPHADVRYFGLTPAQYFSSILFVLGVVWFIKREKS
jgi:phosphatidylglycerol:prolipoprotein diacylglycerol transferase